MTHVKIADEIPHLTEEWMLQVAREVTMEGWGLLAIHGCTRLILDRDQKFTPAFRGFMHNSGAEPLHLPLHSSSPRCLRGESGEI